jgi:hypothetical protein
LRWTPGWNSHPTRKDSRARQPSSNRAIGNHEHLRLLRIFRQISFLDSHSDEDDSAEEHRQTDNDAVAIGLGEKLDSHLVERVLRIALRIVGNQSIRQTDRRSNAEREVLTIILSCTRRANDAIMHAKPAHGVHVGLNGIIAGFTREDPPEQADPRTLMRHRYAKAAHEESRNRFGCPLLGVNWVDSSRGAYPAA